MGEEFRRAVEPSLFPLCHSDAELFGIPVNDGGGQQIEARDAEVLSLRGSVADFPLTPDPEGTFQGVMCFSLVQADM